MKPKQKVAVPARLIIVSGFLALSLTAMFAGTGRSSAKTQDGRPRRTAQALPITPTPTPTPVKTVSQPQTRTTSPTPTPTPTPATSGAPRLGDAPPPPRLKPKPTPTPPEEIEEGAVVRVDTQMVNLHVRVIDRNNKPIGNVQKA